LQEAITFALRNNPRLREAAARLEAARAGADIAFAPFLPEAGTNFRSSAFNIPVLPGGTFVPASLNGGATSFTLAEAGVQWTLYDFGRTSGRYGQAISHARIEELSLQRARQTIAFEVARAYFQALFARSTLRVQEQALRQAESILADTKARRANGVADREAVLRAEVEVSQAREELVGARQLVLDAASTLNLSLGRSTILPVQVQEVTRWPVVSPDLEETLQQAIDRRPEVGIAREAVAEAAYGEKAARADLLPRVYVRGSVIRADSNGPLEGWVTGAGLHVEQPLYAGGRRLAEIRRHRPAHDPRQHRPAGQPGLPVHRHPPGAHPPGRDGRGPGAREPSPDRRQVRQRQCHADRHGGRPDRPDAGTDSLPRGRLRVPGGTGPPGVRPGRRSALPARTSAAGAGGRCGRGDGAGPQDRSARAVIGVQWAATQSRRSSCPYPGREYERCCWHWDACCSCRSGSATG
jgi:hypothetical protein